MNIAPVQKRLRWILWISLVGLADAICLTVIHFSENAFSGICHVSSTIRCDVLSMSKYSEWFGVPVAIYGFLFYLLVLAVSIYALRAKETEVSRPVIYLFFLSLLAVASSVMMASISIQLGAFCPFCAFLYVVSLVFAGCAWWALKTVPSPWFYLVSYDLKRAHRSKWFWAIGIIGLFLISAGRFLMPTNGGLANETVQFASEESRTLGAPEAKVTVVIFSDFQCPFCKVTGEVVHALENELQGRVKVVYKFFPLDSSCNRSGGQHKVACQAARAAYCASRYGKFWPYHDLVYSGQETLKEADLYEFARAVSLDASAFDHCMNDESSMEAVKKDIEEGIKLNLQGTPSIFINGQRYNGPPTLAGLIKGTHD